MKDAAKKQLLEQYLDGSTDDQMSAVIQGWLFNALADRQIDDELLRQFDAMVVSGEPTSETYKRYQQLEHRLALADRRKLAVRRKHILIRAAAVLIPVLAAVGVLFHLSQPKEKPLAENTMIEGTQVVTEPGRRTKIGLADNSQVTVNENTLMIYSDDFKVRREVYVSGEAHFVVEKDPNVPFFVRTKYVTVEVTGTEFNVRAVDGEERMTVSLEQGSVKIVADDRETTMAKGHRFEFDYASRQSEIVPYADGGWWTQPIVFRDLTLSEIFGRIEEYCGVMLRGKENFTDPIRYNIGFDCGESVENMLGTLSRYSGLFTFSGAGKTFDIIRM